MIKSCICPKCGEVDQEKFHPGAIKKGGSIICKECKANDAKNYRKANSKKLAICSRACRAKNLKKHREREMLYYKNNPERIKKSSKKYRAKNKVELNNKSIIYRKNNKVKCKEYSKGYYEDNKDKLKEYNKEYYEANKESIREDVSKKTSALKQQYIEYLGGKCLICGRDDHIEIFDAHHVNPSKKVFGISIALSKLMPWEKLRPELDKCILVDCACHRLIHSGLYTQKYVEDLHELSKINCALEQMAQQTKQLKELV